MKNHIDPKEWAEDFKLFMSIPEIAPPAHIRNEVYRVVRRDLLPSIWLVLSKLGGIHIVVGGFSLLICSQFGMGRGDTLMSTFMSYGAMVCMAFCGALFLGLTTLIAGVILSQSELRKIRRTGYFPIALLGVISFAVFLFFGADIAFSFAVAWFFGALLAGALVMEMSLGVRSLTSHRA